MQILFLEAELLQIFPDESLHSYVLRVTISHGVANSPSDIIGIISPAGVVRTDLVLTEQQRKIFSAFPVMTLMELVRNHMPVMDCPKYLNPKSLAAKCGRIFFHRSTDVSERYILDLDGNSKSIYILCYCPECIREQIQEYGSGWFKLNWLTGKSCDVHNLDLLSIKQQVCSCKLNILDKVVSALSGRCVCCKSEAKFSSKSTSPMWFGIPLLTQKTYGDNKDIPISVCFVRGFEKWLRAFYQRLHDDVNQYVYVNKLTLQVLEKLTYANGSDRSVAPGYLLNLIDIFEHRAYDYFCDFLDKQTEILKIDCSDCVPAEVFVDFKVAKDRDCATCEVRRGLCPFKT